MGTTLSHRSESLSAADVEPRIAHVDYIRSNSTVTVCKVTLDNGFSVRAESGCADPRAYNRLIGEKLARERALAKLINLFEFLAAENRFKQEGNYGQR
jgi:hypothetical protein